MGSPTTPLGDAQPILDPIENAYKKVSGWFKNIPGKGAPSQDADHQAAIDSMNKDLNDKRAEDVADSFRKDQAKPELKPTTPTTRKMIKKAPTKR